MQVSSFYHMSEAFWKGTYSSFKQLGWPLTWLHFNSQKRNFQPKSCQQTITILSIWAWQSSPTHHSSARLKDLGSVTGWKSLGHNGCAALIWPLANSPSESKHWLVQCTQTVFFKTFSAKMAECFDENMWFKAKTTCIYIVFRCSGD